MNIKFKMLTLALILLLGGFLRIYNLSYSPPSLNWDEAALGYNAYSILKTGKDEYGKFLPIFTRSFDDYKSAIPVYLIIPSIKLFGLNDFATGFPSAILGTISVLLIYLLARILSNDDRIAIFSSFVYAIEPWAVHLSRVNYESNEATFFLLLGFFLFLKSKKFKKLLPFSILAFMFSMLTYHSNKIVIPVFMLILVAINFRNFKKYPKSILRRSVLVLSIFIIPYIFLIFGGQVLARATTTSIFTLWQSELSPKLYYFIWDVVGRYYSYFSPMNLFIREPQEPITILAGNSVFHPFEFVPWVVGLVYLFRNYKKQKELFALLLISPIPAILTWNWFQPGRTMSLFAVFSILVGVGIVKIINYLPKYFSKISYALIIIFGLFNAFYLFDSINVYLPFRDYGSYQAGFRETVPVVMDLADNYDQVIIDTPQAQPYIFYLFYGQYEPKKYLSELDLNYTGTPRKHYDFGKFKFRKINWNEDKKLKRTLLVGIDIYQTLNSEDQQNGLKIVGEVKNKYGSIITKLVGTR